MIMQRRMLSKLNVSCFRCIDVKVRWSFVNCKSGYCGHCLLHLLSLDPVAGSRNCLCVVLKVVFVV